MFDLTEKSALITGASGGIGGAIARALHGRGARVALSGTREDALRALAESLGERAEILPCDLADSEAASALAGRASAAMGGLDILVNNAGITHDGLALRIKDDAWQALLDINLNAAFRLCRAALRGMMKQRWGRIINITSIVAVTGNPGQTSYAAAKAGLIGMTKSLAAEVAGRGITVNALAPGMIDTAMTRALDGARLAALLDRIPLGRLGAPAEIAAGVVYLASPEAAYVTGHTLHINGGMAMI